MIHMLKLPVQSYVTHDLEKPRLKSWTTPPQLPHNKRITKQQQKMLCTVQSSETFIMTACMSPCFCILAILEGKA